MKRTAATIFLLFYVSSTLLVQLDRTVDWLENLSAAASSHSPSLQAQAQNAKQTRITESGFILDRYEIAASLPELFSAVAPLPVERIPAPFRLNIRPRSPPVMSLIAS
jgi:hypothetical protein